MSKKVIVKCTGAALKDISELLPFQGSLKNLSYENYEKMKREILDLGFSEPISIWQEGPKLHILNGTQRHLTLTRMREEEGYEIPPIPINYVLASNLREAKKKVLAFASQFGKMTKASLIEYSIENDLDLDYIKDHYSFSDVKVDDLIIEVEDNEILESQSPSQITSAYSRDNKDDQISSPSAINQNKENPNTVLAGPSPKESQGPSKMTFICPQCGHPFHSL